MHEVGGVIAEGQMLGRAVGDVDVGSIRRALAGEGEEAAVGLDANHLLGPFGVVGQPEAGAAAHIDQHLSIPRGDPVQRPVEPVVSLEGFVLPLVALRVAGDVRGWPPVVEVPGGPHHGRA